MRIQLSGRTRAWLPVLVIVIAVSGCDNVSWGGIQLSLKPPGGEGSSENGVAEAVADPISPSQPPGPALLPALYLVEVASGQATLSPILQIAPDGFEEIPSGAGAEEYMSRTLGGQLAIGSEFTLFATGVRVGTFVTTSPARVRRTLCTERPHVRGTIELVEEAAQRQRFLALRKDYAPGVTHLPFRPQVSDRDQRVALLALAREAIPRLGATWPLSVLAARQDVQVFATSTEGNPAVTSTFTYLDQLTQAGAPAEAYSLMLIGEDSESGYRASYTWYRVVGEDGKGVPRLFDHLDIDRDGEDEVLLEIFGVNSRWFAVLSRDGSDFRLALEDSCGA